MPTLKDIVKPSHHSKLTTIGIPNFLGNFDKNTSHQADVWANKSYQVNPKTHVFTTIQEHFSNRLIKSLHIPPEGVVVDIGCFIGEKLWQVNQNNNYLGIGVDIAIPALKDAKKIDIHGHKFIAADLENLPFKDNSLDLIMVFDVIEHLTHPEKGFSEIARTLKPGGRLLLHIPIKDNGGSFFWFKQKLFPSLAKKEYEDVGHSPERMLTRSQIHAHLNRYDLKIEKSIPYNSFFVHFWDREFARITAWILAKLFRRGQTKTSASRAVHTGNIGTFRSIYGRYIVPALEFISIADLLLAQFGIANTYFVIARKS